MFEVICSTFMRARVIWVLSLLVLCTWSGIPSTLEEAPEPSHVPVNQEQPWSQSHRPIWQSGWSPQLWQPQPTGMLWEVDFSPSGELIAAVDITTQYSNTPLAYAAAGGHLRSASLLLKNGANINKQSRWDKSPLLLVAGSNNIKSADFLLKNGADINAVQNWKATCVHETIWWKQPKNLKYFLKKGLSPNTVDGNGHSPLHWAVWGANPNNEDSLSLIHI